jgi:very-short-patch-repair endonuclease
MVEARLRALAAKQHGVFTRRQALTLGLSATVIRDRRATGSWRRVRRGVYAIAGGVHTWEQEAMAAVLDAGEGAVVSHLAAARLWRLTDRAVTKIDITVPHNRKGPRGARRTRSLPERDVRVIGHIPVTSPARTIVDLAAELGPAELEALLDTALKNGRTTIASMRRALDGTTTRGTSVLRRLVADRGSGVPESELERRFIRLTRKARLPQPIRQHKVGNRRVDFAYVDRRIAIELDGRADHGTKTVFEADRRRQNELALAGWLVLRFTWADVTKREDESWRRCVER